MPITERTVVSTGTMTEPYDLGDEVVYSVPAGTQDGGAVYVESTGVASGTTLIFSGNEVTTADGKGGAIYNTGNLSLDTATFSGNSAAQGGAVYNAGKLFMTNTVTLSTESDTVYNSGALIWDFSGANAATVVNYQYVENALNKEEAAIGINGIRVDAEETLGTYVIATGDLSDVASNPNKYCFAMTKDGKSFFGAAVGRTVYYEGRNYKLALNDEKTQLTLTVEEGAAPTARFTVEASQTFNVPNGADYNYTESSYYSGNGGIAEVKATGILRNGLDETVTFRNGKSAGSDNAVTVGNESYKSAGGAIYSEGLVDLHNATFTNNEASGYHSGGAIYSANMLTLSNTSFEENKTGRDGGAICIAVSGADSDKTYATINGGAFRNNQADYSGGAIRLQEGTMKLTDVTFAQNSSKNGGGAIAIHKGAKADFDGVTFDRNTTGTSGGAIFNSYAEMTITNNSEFTGNKAQGGDGGAIVNGKTMTITDAAFSGNTATGKGGAISNSGTATLTNVTFKGNTAEDYAGAIYNTGTMSLTDVTFTENTSATGGAIRNSGTMNLANVTFSGNSKAWGTVYNSGKINLLGEVTLNADQTIYITAFGNLNWVLDSAKNQFGYVNDFSLVDGCNDPDNLTIDAKYAATGMTYTIAGLTEDIAGQRFYITMQSGNTATITVDGAAVLDDNQYYYFLRQGKDGEGNDILTLTSKAAGNVLVTTGDKWFKAGEEITITGTAGIPGVSTITSITVSGYGEDQTVTIEDPTTSTAWSITLPYVNDTAATEITVTGYNAAGEVVGTPATYTLKVDTVAPAFDLTLTAGYVDKSDVNWYKQDAVATYKEDVTDATSGIRVLKLDGEDYVSGTVMTLDTAKETEIEGLEHVFASQDKAGNASGDTFTYGVDGTAPEISAGAFVGGSVYVESPRTVWFKQGDTTAALKSIITDSLSGLASASFNGFAYNANSKMFKIDTTTETELITSTINAIDNVGNEAVSARLYNYGVDGTGPTICNDAMFTGDSAFTDEKTGITWFRKDDSSASLSVTIDDAFSGMDLEKTTFAGAQYDGIKFMLADTTSTDLTITATDNVGNTSTKTLEQLGLKCGVDATGPEITITAEPATDLTDGIVTVTVKATDTESGVYSVGYSFDDNEWTWLSGDTATFTVDQNQLVYVAAYDNVYNKTKDTYQVANICAKTGAAYVATEGKTITIAAGDEYRFNSLTLEDESSFTLGEKAKVFAKTVEMNGGTLDAAEGTMLSETLKVVSGSNELVGVVKDSNSVSNVLIADGADLTVSKDQFDSLMQFTDYASAGKLWVSAVEGNALTENDIQALIGKTAAGTVDFVAQDLTEIHKLTIKDDKVGVIGFQKGYGTEKSDTLRFSKNSNTVFGNTGSGIDLAEGSNKIQVDKNAALVMKAGLTNVSTVKIDKNAVVELQAAVDFADGRSASLKIGRESILTAADITSGDRKLSITSDKTSSVAMNNITTAASNDKLSTGREGSFAAAAIDLGAGSDKISTGKSSTFSADSISGAETVSLGAYSKTAVAGNIEGTKKLSISNGKESSFATLKAAEVTGTDENDSFSFGNWNDVDLDSLNFYDGNDTLKIGSYADVDINSLDFGEGTKDKLTIGKGATLSVNTLDVDSLDTLSMSKGATLYLGSASYDAAMKTEWGKKYSDQISKLA